ncbi:hypothetical protein CLV94_1586 [Flavobacterium endophyticum]|uniref:Uncharacterized protein n=1 Tax=Flavobacterium endophyticum TaxID=1540163 RepID=A0A495MMB1_9FLAO|nr:hypothetical protein [Flavobacterium endophyticum]RKS26525.1 hypothetical protein CLV94_1586 [Flavobacterium endophyticum]
MIKIDTKDHEQLVEIYGRYKEYHNLYGDSTISEEQDQAIRNKATELQGTYDYYKILVLELEKCIGSYHSIRNSLKSKIYPPARKMNTINRKKK